MKQRFLLILLVISINSYAQVIFEQGYFINNKSEKINCLIKNEDRFYNPTSFEYKLNANSDIKKNEIKDVKEFGVGTSTKFVRAKTNVETTSDNVNEIDNNREPNFEEREVFLKTLVEGDANLYIYVNRKRTSFYYNLANSEIEPLVYKKYIRDNKVWKNYRYKQQLFNSLKCGTITKNKIENVDYKINDLVSIFKDYNKCVNSNFVSYNKNVSKSKISLNIRPRVNYSSLKILNLEDRNYFEELTFDDKATIGLGFEIEYIFPFNRNKWAIAAEPSFNKYVSEKIIETPKAYENKIIVNSNYTSIELFFTARHYFYLNNQSKMSASISYVVDLSKNSYIKYKHGNNDPIGELEMTSEPNMAFGLGYTLKEKFTLEVKYQTVRNVLESYRSWNSEFQTVSLILGYNLI